MKLPSFLKRQRKTLKPSFRSYKTSLAPRRKPIKIKKTKIRNPLNKITKHTKKKKQILLFAKGAALLLLLSAGSYFLFFTSYFEIQKIQIDSTEETLDEEATVNTYLQDYLGANILFFQTSKHEKVLLSDFPYLENLKLHRTLPGTIKVSLTPHPQVANIKIIQPGQDAYYLIINDLGFVSSLGVSNETLPTIAMNVTSIDDEIDFDAQIISQEMLEKLLEVSKSYEGKFNMNISETIYLRQAREVHLYTERDFYVWLDLTQDIDEQMTKLKKAMTKLNIYEANLEYIDLRISGQNGEKVIYRLKQEQE
ncbi:hypothetical protein KKC94_03295 [Patescibacteria group bacterium]|nr:hypothetical protein [Patescibacteria group bacterium]